MWTIPSGYMELGESLEAGAMREAYEEANLEYEIIKLYGTYSIPSIGQVLFVNLGKILNENYRAAAETSEVKLFNINESTDINFMKKGGAPVAYLKRFGRFSPDMKQYRIIANCIKMM